MTLFLISSTTITFCDTRLDHIGVHFLQTTTLTCERKSDFLVQSKLPSPRNLVRHNASPYWWFQTYNLFQYHRLFFRKTRSKRGKNGSKLCSNPENHLVALRADLYADPRFKFKLPTRKRPRLPHLRAVVLSSHYNGDQWTKPRLEGQIVWFLFIQWIICIRYCYWIQGIWPRWWQHDEGPHHWSPL